MNKVGEDRCIGSAGICGISGSNVDEIFWMMV